MGPPEVLEGQPSLQCIKACGGRLSEAKMEHQNEEESGRKWDAQNILTVSRVDREEEQIFCVEEDASLMSWVRPQNRLVGKRQKEG